MNREKQQGREKISYLLKLACTILYLENLEDTKEMIRSHKSMTDRCYNGENKKVLRLFDKRAFRYLFSNDHSISKKKTIFDS